MIYVYALSDPLTAAPTGLGVDGAPLRVVATKTLAAVVSDRDAVPVAVDEHALWAHERVVEELMLDRAVLPMRFGSIVRDDASVTRLLVTREQELTEALRRVGGAVELGVRATWPAQETTSHEVAPAASGPGAAYLLARSRRDRRVRALAEQLDRSLVDLSRCRVHRLPTSPDAPLRAAYLVEEEHVDTFRGRIATLERDVGDADIVCTGPWPPYSFTGGQAW